MIVSLIFPIVLQGTDTINWLCVSESARQLPSGLFFQGQQHAVIRFIKIIIDSRVNTCRTHCTVICLIVNTLLNKIRTKNCFIISVICLMV